MTTHIRERILSAYRDLEFDEKRHIYYWEGKKVPKSVSALVKNHVPPFDEAKWLPICARKEKVTIHELKHRWQTINKDACELGTETHDYMEHYNGIKTPTTPQEEAGVKFLRDYLQDYEVVVKEVRMYSRRFGYAGTADLILRHKVTGKLVLADYKTNKSLFGKDEFGRPFDFLYPPFQYLESHNYNHYQLQLSYYELMLNEIGVEISERLLVYLKADSTYKTYSTVDFRQQLEDYLLTNKVDTNVTW